MNTNGMDIDPLSSYDQYSVYHPPFHPLPIPQPQPNIPQTQPDISHALPNISQTQTSISHALPNIPQTQPGISHALPNIPQTQPSMSHTQPDIPSQPNIPYPYLNKGYYPPHPYDQATSNIEQDTTESADQLQTRPSVIEQNVTNSQDTTAVKNDPFLANAPDMSNNITEEEDIKPDITKIKIKKPKKLKGKTSSYWNKKITDKDFKFYGCSVCNISFQELAELDAHVTVHSNRVTSYDVRVQNLKKRKQLKKEKKKKKKEAKVKKEFKIELVIKPEDGYIGTEKAADVNGQTDAVKSEDVENKVKKINDKGKTETESSNQKDAVYKCFACNKKFALSYYLKIHVRSHTDEKPYICNYCGQSFITASKLGRHIKRIHLAIRNQCRICFKFFNRFELLTNHFDKKHAEHKLEGEPYDYNAILPYLTELEEQFKTEAEATKPKTEDSWDEWPHEAPKTLDQAKVEGTKVEKKEKKETSSAELKIEEVEIKYELGEPEVLEPEVLDSEPLPETEFFDETFEADADSSDDEQLSVKRERLPPTDDDEDEYFPPGGCARSPPPSSPSPHTSPIRRKGGKGVCELCNRSFSSRSYLKIHMRTHTGEKPFSCYVCNRGFITASKMHRHVLTHDETWVGENRIKPEGADIKSESEENDIDTEKKLKRANSKIEKAKDKLLKKPNKKMDPKLKKGRRRPHCCEYCDKKFLHVETLQVHKKSHNGEVLVYKCKYCLEPQLDQVAKAEHEDTHKGPKPYICTLCGRQFKERGAMVYHRRNHKANDEKQFICDICSKRFNSQAKLARHIPTHSTEKFVYRFECPVCANMFNTRWHIQMHLKSHQKEGLIQEENRNAVLAMVLQNARKIPKSPQIQSSTAESQPALAGLGGDERSRICNICGQVFQHFYYLEEHLKTHGTKLAAVSDLEEEEEKKFICQVCSKSFKLHYYLKLHSFTHTKEKPFTCQQCSKGFITKGKLKRHLETHQGLKKYQCHICCKFFTRPSYMRIHVRTIHGTQDYNFRDYGIGVPVGLGVAGLGVPLGQLTDNSM